MNDFCDEKLDDDGFTASAAVAGGEAYRAAQADSLEIPVRLAAPPAWPASRPPEAPVSNEALDRILSYRRRESADL